MSERLGQVVVALVVLADPTNPVHGAEKNRVVRDRPVDDGTAEAERGRSFAWVSIGDSDSCRPSCSPVAGLLVRLRFANSVRPPAPPPDVDRCWSVCSASCVCVVGSKGAAPTAKGDVKSVLRAVVD